MSAVEVEVLLSDSNDSRPSSSLSTVSNNSNKKKGKDLSVAGLRGPERKHPVWDYFDHKLVAGKVSSFCRYCNYVNKGTVVTNCKLHLKKHPDQYEEFEVAEKLYEDKKNPKVTEKSTQPSMHSFLEKEKPAPQATKNEVMPYEKGTKKYEALKKKFTELVACTTMTQNNAQTEEFKEYIAECDERAAATIPCRKTATKWVVTYAKESTRKIVALVKKAGKSNVCLDIWSQPGLSYSYLGITIHIFDSASTRFLALGLACTALSQPHTGERIRETLESTLKQWGLNDCDILRYVTDQGANVIKGLKQCQSRHTFLREEEIDSEDQTEIDSDCEQFDSEAEADSDMSIIAEEEPDDSDGQSSSSDIPVTDETVNETGSVNLSDVNNQFESTTVDDQVPATETNQWLEHVQLPKRLSCIAHVLNSACKTVLDKKDSKVNKLKAKVLPLVNKFSKSGVATESLKQLAKKKLLKVAMTGWNSFYYVCNRLVALRNEVTDVCRDRKWDITFRWRDVELCRDLLLPLSPTTNYLQGDSYSTMSCIIPSLLSISEHLMDEEKKLGCFSLIAKELKKEIDLRLGFVMNPNHEKFDPTYLISTILNPEKSTELDAELFDEGKFQFKNYLLENYIDLNSDLASTECADLNEISVIQVADASTSSFIESESHNSSFTPASPSLENSRQNANITSTPRQGKKTKRNRDKEAAEQLISKRRRLQSQTEVEMTPTKSRKELAELELSEYFKIIENGLFQKNTDCMQFWLSKAITFPMIYKVAFQFLSIPATSGSVERLFSCAGLCTQGNRTNLGPVFLESEVLAKFNKKALKK